MIFKDAWRQLIWRVHLVFFILVHRSVLFAQPLLISFPRVHSAKAI